MLDWVGWLDAGSVNDALGRCMSVGAPLAPGEVTEITFDLLATSALIEAGHQIRLAFGRDALESGRVMAGDGQPTITVYREPGLASFVDLPVMRHGS